MNVGTVNTALESYLHSTELQQDIQTALLKKAQDTIKLEGQAALKLIEDAAIQPPDEFHLDTYA